MYDRETIARHRFAEESMAACAELLADTNVRQAIGRYAAIADTLLGALYIPNKRDGVYVAPRSSYVSENGLPYFPVERDETLVVDSMLASKLHTVQQRCLKQELAMAGMTYGDMAYSGLLATDRRRFVAERGEVITFAPAGTNFDGAVSSLRSHGAGVRMGHMPLLREVTTSRRLPGAVLLHELVHDYQELTRVVKSDGSDTLQQRCNDESEAHYVSTTAAALRYGHEAVKTVYPNIYRLEALRSHSSPQDAAYANSDMVHYMSETGIVNSGAA